MVKKVASLHKRAEYMAVYERGRSWGTRTMVMKALPNDAGISRFGLSIGKGVGKAVVRNRVKRRLREIVRRVAVKPGWDIVLIARPETAEIDFAELTKAVDKLLSRARLINGDDERPGTGTH